MENEPTFFERNFPKIALGCMILGVGCLLLLCLGALGGVLIARRGTPTSTQALALAMLSTTTPRPTYLGTIERGQTSTKEITATSILQELFATNTPSATLLVTESPTLEGTLTQGTQGTPGESPITNTPLATTPPASTPSPTTQSATSNATTYPPPDGGNSAGMQVTVTPNPVGLGQAVTVNVSGVSAGAICTIQFQLPNGEFADLFELQAVMASDQGTCFWTWTIAATTTTGNSQVKVAVGNETKTLDLTIQP